MNMFGLVLAIEGEARASSEIIARGVGAQHASVIKLIRKHQADFEALGHVDFKSEVVSRRQGGGSLREFAMLNEQQATLLLAFMRNSKKVVEFKIALVKEFFRMRDELCRREQDLWKQMQALIAREVQSEVRASFGSQLMLERKREIPGLDAERSMLEQQIQPQLFKH
jgi:phage regulator Rha-like protein